MGPLGVHNNGTDGVVVIVKPDLVALIPDDGSYLCREHGNNAWNGERFGLLFIRALEKAFTEPNVGKTVRQIEFEKGTNW